MRSSLKNQKGMGLVEAVIVSLIVGIALLSFQASFLASQKILYRLKLVSAQQSIIASLKVSALNIENFKKTIRGPLETGIALAISKCLDNSGLTNDCIANRPINISWWKGIRSNEGYKIAGTLSAPVYYDSTGAICDCSGRGGGSTISWWKGIISNMGYKKARAFSRPPKIKKPICGSINFGKDCPFQVESKIIFLCSGGVSHCDQAANGQLWFVVKSHPFAQKYVGRDIQKKVPINNLIAGNVIIKRNIERRTTNTTRYR